MSHMIIKKILPLAIILILMTISTTAIAITPQTTTPNNQTKHNTQLSTLSEAEQNIILQVLANNNSGRYFTISAGIRATSFFLKIPRLLTQRGIAFIAEIKYRSPLAFTLVIERSAQTGINISAFERGTHRVIIIGFGHAAFSRPHIGSFGRYIGITKTKPIVF